jgi:glycosyltransferase involved in cell wall biosynthesis
LAIGRQGTTEPGDGQGLLDDRLSVAVVGTRGIVGVQGGIETYCRTIYPLLVELGCEVVVFARRPYAQRGHNRYSGVTVVPLWCPRGKYLETPVHTLLAVVKARRRGATIIQFNAIGSCLLLPVARLLGMKTVVRHVGADYARRKWGPIARQVLRLGEYLGVRFADSVICITDDIADHVLRTYGRISVVIPNAVAPPRRLADEQTLKELGLRKQEYVLAVGRLVPEKAFDLLIEAHSQLPPATRWKLVIVGGESHDRRYQLRLRCAAARAGDVVLAGELQSGALHDLYSYAGLFVIASTHEGMAFAALEALSYTIPVLASDIPGNRALGLNDDSYFPSGDASTLAQHLRQRQLISKSQESPRGVRQDTCQTDVDSVAARTLAVYRELALGREHGLDDDLPLAQFR